MGKRLYAIFLLFFCMSDVIIFGKASQLHQAKKITVVFERYFLEIFDRATMLIKKIIDYRQFDKA